MLYANEYRTEYSEFLRIDFPRVPFTEDYILFQKMGAFGQRLAELHLLDASELDPPLAKYQGTGNNSVDKLKYNQGLISIAINILKGSIKQYGNTRSADIRFVINGSKIEKDEYCPLKKLNTIARSLRQLKKRLKSKRTLTPSIPK